MNRLLPCMCLLLLAACTSGDNGVRVTAQVPEKPAPKKAVPQTRTEPVFYNGKTYQLHFAPEAPGTYAMTVSGMSAGQGKDAEAVATSSLRYFACPDGKTGKLTETPRYDKAVWRLTARCG